MEEYLPWICAGKKQQTGWRRGTGWGGVGWAAAESDLPPLPYFGRRSVFGGATGVFLSTIHTWARGLEVGGHTLTSQK